MSVKIDAEKCVGCGTCVEECPNDALSLEDDIAVVDDDLCVECGLCVEVCPAEALSLD
ncbi:MAG: 4Fe-4S binding protein [Methanocellales archaeon]|nr:4Fe-4S binding protein [Methanocellales archaeon]MDD3292253.1 4Fe-4S binding protein [Methanocellales archaeon]MDD5235959.1 4Fe-4S binding protein [Methanocellales archaeon]MDD5484869.1 4Fe-4S binding protein [Methanocellales archaeon]